MFDMKKTTLIMLCMFATTFQAHAAKLITKTSSSTNTTSASSAPVASEPQPVKQVAPAASTPIIVAANEPAPKPAAPAAAPAPAAPAKAAASGIGTGFYLGAQLGDSSVGAVMGYQFTKMYGMEISYDYFDPIFTQGGTQTKAEKNRLGASGLAMFPLKFSEMGPMALYIKVGYARTTDTLTTDSPSVGTVAASTVITTTTKTGVTGGAGIHVDISQSSSVRLGVNVVGAEHTTYLAALYRF